MQATETVSVPGYPCCLMAMGFRGRYKRLPKVPGNAADLRRANDASGYAFEAANRYAIWAGLELLTGGKKVRAQRNF